jgi:asparagine synthase (glutamine-hydrolysing)
MCGIAGVVALAATSKMPSQELERLVERMTQRMVHRGPDGAGLWSASSGAVALAHRRLAIIDLTEGGRQPMSYAGGRYWITFNGEIYNFRELSAELQKLGHQFRSGSDTEVLLAAVAQWGIQEGIKRLVGMFAFALWDEQERVLHLVRDRLGEKPLYYGEVDGYLYFASELRAFAAIPGFSARISGAAAAAYLRDGCVPGTLSMYEGVHKLAPGHLVTISAGRAQRLNASSYWSCTDVALHGEAAPITDERQAAEELEHLLLQSVRLQMHADVPTGAFLSGGIDSSLVTALMQAQASAPVHTFTVAFDDPRFDESAHARAIATHLGTKHEEFVLREEDVVRQVPSLVASMDEPTANGSFFPVYLISQMARTRVTVVLSGDGGDELFAGYNRYALARKTWRSLRWLPFSVRRALADSLSSRSSQDLDRHSGLLARFTRLGSQGSSAATLAKVARMLRSQDFAESYQRLTYCWDEASILDARFDVPPRRWQKELKGSLAPMLLADQLDYLPDDSLAKVDRASMAVSLETRLPLLDHRLVELSWRLPERLKLNGGVTKRLLRTVLYRHVPRELIERPKMGFSVPMEAWLKGPLRDWASAQLEDRRFLEAFPLRASAVSEAWSGFLQGRNRSGYEMWALVMLAAWARSRA